MEELLGVAARVTAMYLYALALMRLTGKRSLGNLSALDFIVTTVVGDLFDDVFWGTVPAAHGLFAFGSIVFLHAFFAYLGYRFPAFDHLILGAGPTRLVQSSRFDREGMARERAAEDEVYSGLRKLGEESLVEVRQANWESDGRMSVLKKPEAKPAQKRDLARVKEILP